MIAFWDSSALIRTVLPGPPDIRAQRTLHQFQPVLWWATPVEVASALARLRREGHLTTSQASAARRRFDMLQRTCREVQPVAELRELAEDQIERYELRAADALQLAAALVWCNRRPARRHFVSGDKRLNHAAGAEGFTVIDL
jgi:uncharacterized protein